MSIPYICIALLAILVIGGGLNVSMTRMKTNITCGYPDDPAHPMHKAVRAHGNTVEYAPAIALLIYILAQLGPPLWIVVCMVGVTLARYSIYFGLLLSPSLAKPYPMRFLGALFTYIFGLVLGVYLLVVSVG